MMTLPPMFNVKKVLNRNNKQYDAHHEEIKPRCNYWGNGY